MMHPRRKLLPAFLLCFLLISMLVFIYLLKDKGGNRITEAHVMEIFGGRILNKSGTEVMFDLQEKEEIVGESVLIGSDKTRPWSSADKMFSLYDGVKTFVMFIGYPRSSHSLVGAILDAHPEIIIPHEYDLLGRWNEFQSSNAKRKHLQKYLLFYELQQLSMKQALFGIRANNSLLGGEFTYTYNVPGLWQGSYDKRIKVIGDKKGGLTSSLLTNPKKTEILVEIGKIVQVPMKFIHVIRNPFDNIATVMLRATGSRNSVRKEDAAKVNNPQRLNAAIKYYFNLATANQRIRKLYGNAVLDIPGEEIVLRPRETIQKLCDHLGVICYEEYIERCSKILYGTPSITRNTVVWSKEQKNRVTEMIKNYPFLKNYSFEKYPK